MSVAIFAVIFKWTVTLVFRMWGPLPRTPFTGNMKSLSFLRKTVRIRIWTIGSLGSPPLIHLLIYLLP
jgi:hypothetical protein